MKALRFRPGEEILYRERIYRYEQALSLTEVILRDPESGERTFAKVHELSASAFAAETPPADAFSEEQIEGANAKYKKFKKLLEDPKRGSCLHKQVAAEAKVSVATIYRWRKKYVVTGSVTSLVAKRRGVKSGSRRLPDEVEVVMQQVLDEKYLCPHPLGPTPLLDEIKVRLAKRGATCRAPHLNTLRSRLRCISEQDRVRAQQGPAAAEQQFTLNVGSLIADYPLEIAQVDHTLLKVIVVTDDEHRMPIGPAWITVVFDVFSRIVLGIYITLETPSAQSVGEAVANAVLPKEKWLQQLGVDVAWPVWGKPTLIHADNGSDFRSETVEKSCDLHRIDIHWRPVAHPNWGGHIEAYMKTLSRLFKELPGAISKGARDGSGKKAEKEAAMTLHELEVYIVRSIVGRYHQQAHSGIGDITPLQKWNLGLRKSTNGVGLGLPERIVDEESFRIDFWPRFERTISPKGVEIGSIIYYDQVLNTHVNARVPGRPNLKKKFVFRRNNHDLKFAYFWDEAAGKYHKIPAADLTMPSTSLWEWRHNVKESKTKYGRADQGLVIKTLIENRAQIDDSVAKTKKARRVAERRARDRAKQPSGTDPATPKTLEDGPSSIEAFDDVDTF